MHKSNISRVNKSIFKEIRIIAHNEKNHLYLGYKIDTVNESKRQFLHSILLSHKIDEKPIITAQRFSSNSCIKTEFEYLSFMLF